MNASAGVGRVDVSITSVGVIPAESGLRLPAASIWLAWT